METRQKDYMMRQFNQLAKVIARLLGFKDTGAWDEAEAVARDAYKDILGIPAEELLSKSDQDILLLFQQQSMRLDTMEKFCVFLSNEADVFIALGAKEKAKRRLTLAGFLMEYIIAADALYVMDREKSKKLWSNKLKSLSL